MTQTAKQTNTKTTTDVTSTLLALKDAGGTAGKLPLMDVRGWSVAGPDGTLLGSIDRILLDTTEKQPRYLSVSRTDKGGRLLLPIGVATPVPADRKVKVGLKVETVNALPVLDAEVVTHDFERHVFTTVTGKKAQTMTAREWYADPVFDPAKLMVKKQGDVLKS